MALLVDTGYLYALADTGDQNHVHVLRVAQTIQEELILPATVLPEVCYLLHSRLGHAAMRSFLHQLTASSVFVETLQRSDLPHT